MTVITLFTGKNGVLKKCKANGHADFSKKGSDIVCSAVTILLRTALKTLSQSENVILNTAPSSRGSLAFSVDLKEGKTYSMETQIKLKTIADFLREGFVSLQKEFPDNVQFSENTEV